MKKKGTQLDVTKGNRRRLQLGEDLIEEKWRGNYRERHLFFMNELVQLHHYVFYLERIAAFPWRLLGEIHNHFWEFTFLSMFETSSQIASRIAFDRGPKKLTLPKFATDIQAHLVSQKSRKSFEENVKKFDFPGRSDSLAKKIKFLRDNRFSHLSGRIVSPDLAERPYLESVSVRELREIADFLYEFFQIVSLGVHCALTLPDLVDHSQSYHSEGTEPDIVKLLNSVAKSSRLLNMPEERPQAWSYRKDSNFSESELAILNEWRAKFNLPPA
jgi:hypothetical protein